MCFFAERNYDISGNNDIFSYLKSIMLITYENKEKKKVIPLENVTESRIFKE